MSKTRYSHFQTDVAPQLQSRASLHHLALGHIRLTDRPYSCLPPQPRLITIHNHTQLPYIAMQSVEATAYRIEAITGYNFTHKLLCVEAVQMASPQVPILYNGSFRDLDNNKRLALLTMQCWPKFYAPPGSRSVMIAVRHFSRVTQVRVTLVD